MPIERPLKRCQLSGKSIRSLEDFYDQIARELRFPAYFGRNLDALWDVLTTDVEGPVQLIWEDSAVSKKSMGKDFEKVLTLLEELQKERSDFRVTFR